jgi:UDPglucose 6-dehydrogenase
VEKLLNSIIKKELTSNKSPIIPFYKGDENNKLEWKTISIWGLAFKPKTDDIRDAPSIEVINKLLELWVKEIKVFDPVAIENMKNIFWDNKKIQFCQNNYEAIKNSDALLILTEWDEFRNTDFEKIKNLMKWNIIVDWRNIYNKKEIENLGFIYEWIWKWN